jgi:hypothetical protein
LLEKLKTVKDVKPVNKLEVNDEELKFLVATAEYALENCPVEGKIMMEDGQLSSTEMFEVYLSKLRSYQSKTASPPS